MADRALYLAKPEGRVVAGHESPADPYLRALDETALALLDRHDPTVLLETILTRATALLGTPHGYIYLVEPDERALVVRHGSGLFSALHRPPHADRRGPRRPGLPDRRAAGRRRLRRRTRAARRTCRPATFGSVVGVPLASGGHDGRRHRAGLGDARTGAFGPREIDALRALRPARLDRPRQLAAVRRRPARRPARPDDRPAEPRAADRPDRATRWPSSAPTARDPVAVILLDLDRFKVINESVGHAVGDRLLAAVGQRLVGCLRPGDTVARFGGDEFGIILDPVVDADDARRIAERIGTELRAPFPMGGREWFISASIGIAVGRPGRATPGEMLREAEIAMVRAKGDPSTPLRPVRAVDVRPDDGPDRHGERPAPGHRARRAARPLPAARRPARPTGSSASRRSSAGSTRSAAWSRRSRSSRSPRRPG